MKVLHVIPALAPRYGGAREAVLGMCCALEKEGVECLIASTDADGKGRLPVELERLLRYEGARVIFFSLQWSETFKYSRPLARWLRTHIKDFNLVVIHAIFSYSSLVAGQAARRYGVPYVVVPIGSLSPWSLKQKRFRKRILWHMGVETFLQHAAAIQYTTETERELGEESLGLNHGAVIPLGVNEEFLNRSLFPHEFPKYFPQLRNNPYVLTLSRLHPKKNLERLIEAFMELIKEEKLRHWRLVVAGDGERDYVRRLRSLVTDLGGESHVFFTGWLEGAVKRAAFSEASLFVLPSHQENFGLAAAEAMAVGLPVIVSDQVGIASDIREYGAGIVVPCDVYALAPALESLVTDPERRSAMGRQGQRLVKEKYSPEKARVALLSLYSRTIQARKTA